MRQYLFAKDQWDKHVADDDLEGWLTDLAFQRSGLNGTLDPIIQVATHLRYQSDLATLMEGAAMNWFLKNAQDVIQPFTSTNDSPNTNTRIWNATKGGFNLAGVPAAAWGLTMLGTAGGPLGRLLAGAAMQFGTSPQAAASFADFATGGEKGTQRIAEDDEEEKPEKAPPEPKEKDDEDAEPEKKGGVGGAGMGLLDDIIAPTWRYTGPLLNRLPSIVKVGAGIAGAGYAGHKYLEATEPFRGGPPPKGKDEEQ